MLASGRLRKAPERSRSARTTAATSVSGAVPDPWYGMVTTAMGKAEALPPTMSISNPCCWADAATGSNRKTSAASQWGSVFMGTSFFGEQKRDNRGNVNIFAIMNGRWRESAILGLEIKVQGALEHRLETPIGQRLGA